MDTLPTQSPAPSNLAISPGITAPATTAASNPPAPATSQEPPPGSLAMNNTAPTSNLKTVAPTQPQNGENTPATENAAADNSDPVASPPVHKPSMLNPFNWFGGRAKPAPGTPEDAANGSFRSTLTVTPLPPAQPLTHYTPPPVMMYKGNRMEADRQMHEAIAAEKDSRLKEAMAGYQEAIKADPGYYEACLALGLVAIKAEEYAAALEALHHALTLKPDSAEARYGYAWALEKKHYYQDASKELEIMLRQHPDEIRAHLLLAEVYAQHLGQPDQARVHYQKVLEADPQNPQATAIRFWLQANPGH